MTFIKKTYKDLISKYYSAFVFSKFLRGPKRKTFNKIIEYFRSIPILSYYKKRFRERNVQIIKDDKVYPKIGLVLNLDSHIINKWLAGITRYYINGIIQDFNCIIIENQKSYNKYKEELDVIIAYEPGYGCPFIKYQRGKPDLKYIQFSDPHLDVTERLKYILNNDFSYLLVIYYNPTIYHFKNFPKEKIVHFPWAIPEIFINKGPIKNSNQDKIMIFGQTHEKIYETRRWCEKFKFVDSMPYSAINKVLNDIEYFRWLQNFDAIIAAGSLNPKYRLVMVKYFEIAASGALLFAQEAEDLDLLGFKDFQNCIIFNKKNFEKKAQDFLQNREDYLKIRENGRNLILERHTLQKRIEFLKEHIKRNLDN
ncbi:MAG: glycosyltransferase [Promethearchaeota archaeon]